MKNHLYKRGELILFVYDALEEGISIADIMKRTGVSRSAAYVLIEDIQLYISDFYRYDIEIYKKGSKFFKRKN